MRSQPRELPYKRRARASQGFSRQAPAELPLLRTIEQIPQALLTLGRQFVATFTLGVLALVKATPAVELARLRGSGVILSPAITWFSANVVAVLFLTGHLLTTKYLDDTSQAAINLVDTLTGKQAPTRLHWALIGEFVVGYLAYKAAARIFALLRLGPDSGAEQLFSLFVSIEYLALTFQFVTLPFGAHFSEARPLLGFLLGLVGPHWLLITPLLVLPSLVLTGALLSSAWPKVRRCKPAWRRFLYISICLIVGLTSSNVLLRLRLFCSERLTPVLHSLLATTSPWNHPSNLFTRCKKSEAASDQMDCVFVIKFEGAPDAFFWRPTAKADFIDKSKINVGELETYFFKPLHERVDQALEPIMGNLHDLRITLPGDRTENLVKVSMGQPFELKVAIPTAPLCATWNQHLVGETALVLYLDYMHQDWTEMSWRATSRLRPPFRLVVPVEKVQLSSYACAMARSESSAVP